MRLQSQITLSLLMTCLLCSFTISASLLGLEMAAQKKKSQSEAQLLLIGSIRVAEQALVSEDFLMLPSYLESLRAAHPEILRVRVRRSGNWTTVGTPSPQAARESLWVLTAAVPHSSGERDLAVEIAFSRGALERETRILLAESVRRIVWATGFAGFVSLILGFLLARRMTSPIRELIRMTREIAEGKLQANVQIGRGWAKEVRLLVKRFNEMAEKLSELDRMKSDFVSSITHELRSPLGAIDSCAELMLDPADPPSNDEREELLRVVKDNARRLESLVSNLLEMARIERGALDHNPQPVDIVGIVRDAVLFLQPRASENGLKLAVDLAHQRLGVRADSDRIQQVMINLISNAIKFTPPGGNIKVYAKRVDGGVECGVHDSGPGIPASEQVQIFRPFERGSSAGRTPGAGIGLSLSKMIVEMHGGRIAVESRPMWGSRFYFILPELDRTPVVT